MRPSKRVNKGTSGPRASHTQRVRGNFSMDSGFYSAYNVNHIVSECWCGEAMGPTRNLCTECYNRLPAEIQRSLSSKTRFIDSYGMRLKAAIGWLKGNSPGEIK